MARTCFNKYDLSEIDKIVEQLVNYYSARKARIILLSEYGITSVDRPVHINRELRKNGFLQIRNERGLELLDAGASKAFAVADHQVAHIYINDPLLCHKYDKYWNRCPVFNWY